MTPSNEPPISHTDDHRLQALLSEYAASEARGQDVATLFPTMAALLATDARLRADLIALRASIGGLYEGIEGGARAPHAEPDLSFLRHPTSVARVEPPQGIGQQVIRFSQALLDEMRPRQLVRGEQKARGQRLYHYHTAAQQAGEIDLTVDIFAEGEEQVTVSVMAIDPRHDPFAQGGISLSLSWDEGRVEGESDATGYAVFTAIPTAALPDLIVVASPA